MKYIPSDKLIAEIERTRDIAQGYLCGSERRSDLSPGQYRMKGIDTVCSYLLSFIESVEKESEEPKWDSSDMRYDENELLSRFAFYTYKDEPEVLYLSNLFVTETFRNKGRGTKILEAAEKVAETIGAITITLKVKQGTPANAWYRKRGYGFMTFEGDYDWLEKNLEYIKPKKEPEVDLEKAYKSYMKSRKDDLSGNAVTLNMKDLARHFYELGLNAK